MAHEIGGNTARLEFGEGTALAGATVRVSLDMNLRRFIALQRAVAKVMDPGDTWDALLEAYAIFAEDALLEWDLTLRGEPVPATEEGLLAIPRHTATAIFRAFIEVVMASDPNSAAASESGPPSGAAFEQTAAA